MPTATPAAWTAASAWLLLLAALATGTLQSCEPGAGDAAALAGIALLLAGAALAYAAIVLTIWPVRRSGDMAVTAGAPVAAVAAAPFVGLAALLPVAVAVGYAFARVQALDGAARGRPQRLLAIAAGWYPAAFYVFLRIAFHCGLW